MHPLAVVQNIVVAASAVFLTIEGYWPMAIVIVLVLGLTPKNK